MYETVHKMYKQILGVAFLAVLHDKRNICYHRKKLTAGIK